MGTGNRALFGLLLLLLVFAAFRLTLLTAARKGAARTPHALGRDPTARPFPLLQVGAPAPDALLLDRDGHEYRLSEFRGHRVLVAFFCGSPRCVQIASQWEKIRRQALDVIVLGISTTGPQDICRFGQETHVKFPLLFDPSYQFSRPDDRAPCPSSAVIDEDGIVVYLSGRSGNSQTGSNTLRQHLRLRPEIDIPRRAPADKSGAAG
jgi:peroxiredoxin